MFVVFEGIDGSGKTTVSNRVAKELRKRGVAVNHIREGGEFASALVNRMRLFGKDTRNLSMAPLTELLFYVARDAQNLAESILPALAGDDLVFADRYLYSYEVLSHHGRGLDMSYVRPILDAVANGVWPDLVVLMDVDPHVARARRRVSKIVKKANKEITGGGSRKGLGGKGAQHRFRRGYQELAARDPERWMVVDNADVGAGLDAVVERVVTAIAALAAGKAASTVVASDREQAPVPVTVAAESVRLSSGRDAFYRAVAARAVREPEVAAYFLVGLDDDESYGLRQRLAPRAADIVAYGLRGLGDEAAWAMREELASSSPHFVARSLDGLQVEGPRAEAMRLRFVDREPAAVLATLDGVDSPAAWALRDQLWPTLPRNVLTSLKRIDSERAWALRDVYFAEHGVATVEDPLLVSPLVHSLRGLAGERAWQLRRRYLGVNPTAVLWSLVEVDDDEAWALRDRLAGQAPKIVLRTFDGVDDARAWALRHRYAARVKEAVDSLIGVDGDDAWAIREACIDIWPSTVVKSINELIFQPRGVALAERVLGKYPANISLLKHVARATSRLARGPLPESEIS